MDLNTITVADFKAQFYRGFPYLPTWVAGTYNSGVIVYYSANQLFYQCLTNGTSSLPPNDPANWILYPASIYDYVLDNDITTAFGEAQIGLNQELFTSDANIKLGYLYLTAFYLMNDLQTANSGAFAAANYALNSRTAGNVTESYTVPESYINSPQLMYYSRNWYGQKYLSFIQPFIVGNIGIVAGTTLP